MNKEETVHLSFNAYYIEDFDINYEIASDCVLRSHFVHEKIIEARDKEAAYPIRLLVCEKGIKIIRSIDQMVMSSHSIKRISYSACDRINNLFALVVHSVDADRSQICFIFRMHTFEQADTVNRYFGNVFKMLQNRRRENKSKCTQNDSATSNNSEILPQLDSSSSRHNEWNYNSENSLDRDCSDPRLVTEMSSSDIRRLSLSMPNAEFEEGDDGGDQLHPLHSSLEKKGSPVTDNIARPFVRRKKNESKGNRISAVIERFSFRGSKEVSSDLAKSGSPVVALKEQIEYEELLSADSSLGSDYRQEPSSSAVCLPQARKQLLPSNSNLCINNDCRAASVSTTKNSASTCQEEDSEEPPVPPQRIHSLRTTVIASSESGPGKDGVLHNMPVYDDNDDDDFSSITTPSSGDRDNHPPVKFDVCDADGTADGVDAGGARLNGGGASVPGVVAKDYLRDMSKEQAMECLLGGEVGGFLVRPSGSQRGCMALSVKVGANTVSHYIIQPLAGPGLSGYRMRGLAKTWPDLESLLAHLSVMPEMLPCPLAMVGGRPHTQVPLPPSRSPTDEYRHRISHFLDHLASPAPGIDQATKERYQRLSEFSSSSSAVAGLDF